MARKHDKTLDSSSWSLLERVAVRRYFVAPDVVKEAVSEARRSGGLKTLGNLLQQRRAICGSVAIELNKTERELSRAS